MKIFRQAFTLAEILITLGIIGIVAAMTIPVLIKSYQTQVFKTQLKKGMSVAESAFRQAVNDNGGSLAGYGSSNIDFKNFVQPYFAYTKTCDNNSTLCQPVQTPYKAYSGVPLMSVDGGWSIINYSSLELNDGSILYFHSFGGPCTSSLIISTQDACGILWIDVNGTKGPNQAAYDMFQFWVSSTGTLVPCGTKNDAWMGSYSNNAGYTANIMDMLN